MNNKAYFLKNSIVILLLSLSMSIYAQKGQVGEKRLTTKYEEFISQSGTFIKFTDILLPPINQYYTDGISGVVRTFWGQNKNYYFLILTKSSLSEGPRAMIEYGDLLELNKAFVKLLDEVDEDVKIRTEFNYLENKYVTYDNFKLGYYIERKKPKWFIQFNPYTEVTRISYHEDFYKLLQNAQECIEQIMAREGK